MIVLEGMGLPGEQRVARAPFPLTPALSLWEREQHLPRWFHVRGARCANQRSKMVHPLPKGEGRGEGEGTVKVSIHAVHGKRFCRKGISRFESMNRLKHAAGRSASRPGSQRIKGARRGQVFERKVCACCGPGRLALQSRVVHGKTESSFALHSR